MQVDRFGCAQAYQACFHRHFAVRCASSRPKGGSCVTGSWLAVAAAFGLVALNGFFVATEFALVKVRPTRLDELARRGSAAARRAKRLVEHLDEYLSATQLGITLASLALGWIGEPAFALLIKPLAARLGLAASTREAIAAGLAFLII